MFCRNIMLRSPFSSDFSSPGNHWKQFPYFPLLCKNPVLCRLYTEGVIVHWMDCTWRSKPWKLSSKRDCRCTHFWVSLTCWQRVSDLLVPLWRPSGGPAAGTSYWSRAMSPCWPATSRISCRGFGWVGVLTWGSCRCLETPWSSCGTWVGDYSENSHTEEQTLKYNSWLFTDQTRALGSPVFLLLRYLWALK